MKGEAEIYCPHCTYRPTADDRWWCYPGCSTEWNTFWTRGVCPGCGHQWRHTQCLACEVTSLHEHWYHYPGGDEHPAEEHNKENELADACEAARG